MNMHLEVATDIAERALNFYLVRDYETPFLIIKLLLLAEFELINLPRLLTFGSTFFAHDIDQIHNKWTPQQSQIAPDLTLKAAP